MIKKKQARPGSFTLLHDCEDARISGRRGTKLRSAEFFYSIENERVTMTEIGARNGISHRAAQERYRYAVKLDGPVTWERLAMTCTALKKLLESQ